jgi:GTP-binding protein
MSGKMGPPDGMAGADGGDVYLRASSHVPSLIFPTQHFRGHNGENGKIKAVGKSKAGDDRYIDVPLGTVVHEVVSSTAEIKAKQSVRLRQVADLDVAGKAVCVARGGKGGLGNRAFRDPMRRDCNFSQIGKPGDENEYVLELKVIAGNITPSLDCDGAYSLV